MRINVPNNDENLDVRGQDYYAFLTYGRKRCGDDFLGCYFLRQPKNYYPT